MATGKINVSVDNIFTLIKTKASDFYWGSES